MRYAIDSQRQAMKATGIVNPTMAWEDTSSGRRPSKDQQERHEQTGMPLWDVEVSYKTETFGQMATANAMVRVGAPDRPVPEEYSPITFKVLQVEVYKTKAGGIGERWTAEAIDQMAAMPGGKAPAKNAA